MTKGNGGSVHYNNCANDSPKNHQRISNIRVAISNLATKGSDIRRINENLSWSIFQKVYFLLIVYPSRFHLLICFLSQHWIQQKVFNLCLIQWWLGIDWCLCKWMNYHHPWNFIAKLAQCLMKLKRKIWKSLSFLVQISQSTNSMRIKQHKHSKEKKVEKKFPWDCEFKKKSDAAKPSRTEKTLGLWIIHTFSDSLAAIATYPEKGKVIPSARCFLRCLFFSFQNLFSIKLNESSIPEIKFLVLLKNRRLNLERVNHLGNRTRKRAESPRIKFLASFTPNERRTIGLLSVRVLNDFGDRA